MAMIICVLLHIVLGSVRTDNRYVSVSADISVIGRYIGFADMENAYRYRLSVSADKVCHIGSITDILNWVDDLFSWMIFDKRFRDFRIFFSDRVVW